MFNGLVGYAGEVADGAQAAWDHAEESDARYKSGDVEGGAEADLAFLGGLAQRSHNAGCGGRWAARSGPASGPPALALDQHGGQLQPARRTQPAGSKSVRPNSACHSQIRACISA